MSKNASSFALALIVCTALLPLEPVGAATVYRSDEGWTVEGEDTAVEGSAAGQMRKAEKAEAKGSE